MFSLKYLRQTQRSLLTKYQICRTLTQAARAINDRGSDFFDPLLEKFFFFNINTLRENQISWKFPIFTTFSSKKTRIFSKKKVDFFWHFSTGGSPLKFSKIAISKYFQIFLHKYLRQTQRSLLAKYKVNRTFRWPAREINDRVTEVQTFLAPYGKFCFSSTLIRFATINFKEIFRIFSNFSMQNRDFSGKIQKGGVAFLLNYANFMLIYFFCVFC